MADDNQESIPAGAIPEEEFNKNPPEPSISEAPPAGAIPEEEFNGNYNQAAHGSASEMAKTALEQGASGLTGGLSKVLETKGIPAFGIPAITTPEAIAGREEANPITSFLSNAAGTTGLLAATGGVGGLLAKGAGAAAKIGAGAVEGGILGSVNKATDDWSQNKPLDAQKLAASAGLGALIGGAGTFIGEKLGSIIKTPEGIRDGAEINAENALQNDSAPVEIPKKLGVQPTSLNEMQAVVADARERGVTLDRPAKAEVEGALNRLELKYPVNPAQLQSLTSEGETNIYQIAKEEANAQGNAIKQYEALQKYDDLVPQIQQTIENIAPDYQPTTNLKEAGARATEAYSDVLDSQKKLLGQAIGALKETPIEQIPHLSGVVEGWVGRDPNIANMFETTEPGVIDVKKAWDPQMGIARKTYSNLKTAIKSIDNNNPDLEGLFSIRKELEDGINLAEKSDASSELTNAKASMMDYIQNLIQKVTPDANVRQAFANYAKNEENIEFVEKKLGAKIGSTGFRSQFGGRPEESILGRIFQDSALAQKSKELLPTERFNQITSDYLNSAKANVTDKGEFSSNKFSTFLKSHQYGLEQALSDNPAQLQKLKDLTLISRMFPDATPVVVGAGKTLLNRLENANIHGLTWEGMLASLGKGTAQKIGKTINSRQLNQALAGQALQNAQTNSLKTQIGKVTKNIDKGVKALFSGASAQSGKIFP